MQKKIIDRIAAPPVLTKQEQAHANTVDWSDTSPATTQLIERLADALGTQQNWTCSFCKLPIQPQPGRALSYDVEHFIEKKGKKHYSLWQFEPLNLSLACRDCNRRKRWRRRFIFTCAGKTKADASQFPTDSNDYDLIHPHFDVFTNFLQLHRGWVYKFTPGMETNSKAINHYAAFNLKSIAQSERRNRLAKLASASKLGRIALTVVFHSEQQAAVTDLIREMRAAAKLNKQNAGASLEAVAQSLPPLTGS